VSLLSVITVKYFDGIVGTLPFEFTGPKKEFAFKTVLKF
jgi:hypothetical protein